MKVDFRFIFWTKSPFLLYFWFFCKKSTFFHQKSKVDFSCRFWTKVLISLVICYIFKFCAKNSHFFIKNKKSILVAGFELTCSFPLWFLIVLSFGGMFVEALLFWKIWVWDESISPSFMSHGNLCWMIVQFILKK